jgi:DNA repair protein RadC
MPFYAKPRYKLKEKGAESLDEIELLSLILGDEKKACTILNNINIHEFQHCSLQELYRLLGNRNDAFKILALSELFKRYNKLSKKGFVHAITKPEDVYALLADEVKEKKQEIFYGIYLDNANRILEKRIISIGTLNSTLLHPREVFKPAIKASANAIILVHNHPSGSTEPSEEDLQVTDQIIKAGRLLDIKVLDHIIIGDGWRSLI